MPKAQPLLTSSSSLQEVFNANIPVLTDNDLLNQSISPLKTGVTSLTGTVGLAGFNLDQFMLDCNLVDNCKPSDYYEYDGFAIVFQWFDTIKTNTSLYWGWCLPDQTCIFADPTFSTYDFKQTKLIVFPTAIYPTPSSLSTSTNQACTNYNMGFSDQCFGWNPTQLVTGGTAYAWRFMKTKAQNKYQSNQPLTIWGVVSQTNSQNVLTSINIQDAAGLKFAALGMALLFTNILN